MFDWLKSIIKGHKHCCWECNKYISNEKINDLFPNNNTYCEGGGFCCPIKGLPYFIGRDKHDKFCYKFKFRNTKMPKFLKKRKIHEKI